MKRYDVTIGIPVYNSVDVIQESLLSALSQSFSCIEYLLVDDGCTDSTFEIVAQIINKHSKHDDVRIIKHHNNLGVSVSRNQIIDEAQGDYLYFMDSDDTIAENTIELLMKNVRKYDAEIVFGSYERIDISGKKTIYQYPFIKLFGKDELACYAYRKYAGIQASACNYLVKTLILRDNNLRFINTNYWEDFVFTFDLVTLISRAVLLPDITYSYICRENSLSHYQQRERISKDEIMQNVYAIDYLKATSSLLYNKVYFPNRCFNIAMTDFYIICNVLKRRKDIYPKISDKEIKLMMVFPASFSQVCRFRQTMFSNIVLYVISILPSMLCIFMIKCIGKLKNII